MILRDINGNTRSHNAGYCSRLARGHAVSVDTDSTGLVMVNLGPEVGGGQVCLRPWDNARLYADAISGALVGDGASGQDRESYSDTQDRESYTTR